MPNNQPITPFTQHQSNIAMIMNTLGFPKVLEKQEKQKRIATLSSQIKALESQITALRKQNKMAVDALNIEIASLEEKKTQNEQNLVTAQKNQKTRKEAEPVTQKNLLIQESLAIAKNENQMLGQQQKAQKAAEEKRALERKRAENQQSESETQKEPEPEMAEKASISMSMLRQICNRAENNTFFQNISDADFEQLKNEVEPLLVRRKALEELTKDEYEKISIFELEDLKRAVKLLLADHQAEADASVVQVDKDKYEKVSALLAKQKQLIAEKIKKENEKEEKAGKPAVSAELKSANDEVEKCQQELDKTNRALKQKASDLWKLRPAELQKKLDSYKKELEKYQENKLKNTTADSAELREKKIKIKKKLHAETKTDVVKQIQEEAMRMLAEKIMHIKSSDPKLQEQLDRNFVNQMKALESNALALESAVEYCIAQLEQASTSEQEALKKKCYKQNWKNEFGNKQTKTGDLTLLTPINTLQMSDILELTYYAYLNKALLENIAPKDGKVSGAMRLSAVYPALKAEVVAHQKKLQGTETSPEKQPTTRIEPTAEKQNQEATPGVPLPPPTESPPSKTPEQQQRHAWRQANPPPKRPAPTKPTATPAMLMKFETFKDNTLPLKAEAHEPAKSTQHSTLGSPPKTQNR